MHVLMLCKRKYTSRDLLDDRYGRLYEIPEGLARLGHRVSGLALSYRRRPDHRHVSPAGVEWQSINFLPAGPWQLARLVGTLAREACPNVVLASSDAPSCVLGLLVARRLRVPLVLDLYDNYEHFGLTRLPGMRAGFRYACRQADGLSVISHTLADHLRMTSSPGERLRVIGNGVRTDVFKPMDTQECRRRLGLPANAQLIGCAGAIDASRGIEDMFRAFLTLADSRPNLRLVFAGPRDHTPERFQHPRIIDLGILPWQQVPLLVNSLDVSLVCNADSTFGRYCFPLKLYESLACQTPTIAASVGDIPMLLAPEDGLTYSPGDSNMLAEAIVRQLALPTRPQHRAVEDWDARAASVHALLNEVAPAQFRCGSLPQ